MMFEPFQSELVEDFSRFNYFLYRRPEQRDDELRRYVSRVLSGDIRHPWIDRHVDVIWPERRLIKDIRACLFLRWIHDRFRQVPLVFIVRHPCAVVASRLRLNWATDDDIRHFVSQGALVEDFLGDKIKIIEDAKTEEEKHAIVWSVSNLVPLQQLRDQRAHIMFYENLLLHPEQEIPQLFDYVGQNFDDTVFGLARRASMTTKTTGSWMQGSDNPAASWQREMSDLQIRRVLGIVEQFGLGNLYDDSGQPTCSNGEKSWS